MNETDARIASAAQHDERWTDEAQARFLDRLAGEPTPSAFQHQRLALCLGFGVVFSCLTLALTEPTGVTGMMSQWPAQMSDRAPSALLFAENDR